MAGQDTSYVEVQGLAPMDHEAVWGEAYVPASDYKPRHSGEGAGP